MIDPSLNESHGFSPSFRISLFYRGEKKKQQLVFFFSSAVSVAFCLHPKYQLTLEVFTSNLEVGRLY